MTETEPIVLIKLRLHPGRYSLSLLNINEFGYLGKVGTSFDERRAVLHLGQIRAVNQLGSIGALSQLREHWAILKQKKILLKK